MTKQDTLAEQPTKCSTKCHQEPRCHESPQRTLVTKDAADANLEALGQAEAGGEQGDEPGRLEPDTAAAAGRTRDCYLDLGASNTHLPDHCHHQGGRDGLEEGLQQTDFSLVLNLFLFCFLAISLVEVDNLGCAVLRIEVEGGQRKCFQFVLVSPDPGQPGEEVVQQEGDQEGRRPFRMTFLSY